ncbi:MAG: carbohydrate kinase family protein [Clostridiales bacterium]|nr:carbohydrate kinase family protein [Clostridiales bacterium]
MVDIVGVGHCCQDYLCIIENYPPEDGSTHITQITSQGGGAVATAMVAAARLGIHTGYIGNLGDDEIGDMIISEFQQEQVNVSTISRLPNVKSLSSYVMIQPENGTRTKFPYQGKIPPISWDEKKKEMLRNAKILHLDGTDYENALNAALLAKEYGVTISLDGCSRQQDNSKNKELASMADILIMNAVYPMAVSGKSNIKDALLEISTWGPKIILSTAGANGVYAVIDRKVYHYKPCKAKVVDTTGAGDVFHGAFLVAYLMGKSFDDCIGFAQYTAAIKCGQIGGRTGIPDLQRVEKNYKCFTGTRL